jgi:hypothetical protein
VCPDHDQICRQLLCHPHDLRCHVADRNDHLDRRAVVLLFYELSGVRPELLEILGCEHDGWVEYRQVGRTRRQHLSDDVQRRDVTGILSSQRDCSVDCVARVFGKINGAENAVDRDHD